MTLLWGFDLLSEAETETGNDTSEKSGMFNRHSTANQTPQKQGIHSGTPLAWDTIWD